MYQLQRVATFQRFCRSAYCCRRSLADTTDPIQAPDPTKVRIVFPNANPATVSQATHSTPPSLHLKTSSKHITPSSDLSLVFQQKFDRKHKEIFGGKASNSETSEKKFFRDYKYLHPSLINQLETLGFDKPLPVQARALDATLKGKDAVIKSITGSGKTLAFVVPMLNKVGPQRSGGGRHPQAIIVAPTREICRQIAQVVEDFIGEERLMTMIGGGVKVRKQAKKARGGERDIIIATPGRVMQLVSMNIIRPEKLKFLVLDEADELLVDIFYTQMRLILDHSNSSKQMIVTTATVPPNVQFVIDRYMKFHEYIDLGEGSVALPAEIRHKAVLYTLERGVFKRALQWVLSQDHAGCSMVFVRYKDDCSKLTELIREWGYTTKFIHADVPENNRVKVMQDFRDGNFEILVATDVAARGVDVPECGLVVHVKPSPNSTKYIHRAGRTGRAGRGGTSVLMLINEREPHMDFLGDLSDFINFEYYLYSKSQKYRLEPKK